jgi:hypothetical protein
VEARVAAPAVLLQVAGVDARTGVFLRQYVVLGVAVATAGHRRRVAQFLDLPVVGGFVIGHHFVGEVVALHHGAVGMAALALLCVELAGLGRVLFERGMEHPGIVQAMAIGAAGGVLIALQNRLAVARGRVVRISVALGALLDDGELDVFVLVLLDRVDVAMAVAAAEVFLNVMEVVPVFLRDLLVAAPAVDGGGLLLAVAVLLDVRDPHVAARAAVVGVDRFVEIDAVERLIVTEPAVLGRQGGDGQADDGEYRQQNQFCPKSLSPLSCLDIHRFHPFGSGRFPVTSLPSFPASPSCRRRAS